MEDNFTQGEKKILLQFERFVETVFFKKEVARIRKAIKIPVDGIKPSPEDLIRLTDLFRIPTNFPVKKLDKGHHPMDLLNIETRKIVDMLPVNNIYLTALVKYYILFDKLLYTELTEFREYFRKANVCEIEDAQGEFEEYAPNDDPESFFSIRAYIEMLEEKLWKYPVVIRIHPDASQRDIIEYIKTHWSLVKYYQDQYVNEERETSFKNSKTKENIRLKERNDFIYQNKDLPRKTIMQMVNKGFGADLDQGSIGKIISLERKKREKK
jgi:hypothetical protein